MFVKTQLHIHNSEDVLDTFIKDTPEQIIDYAQVLGFRIISFTNHASFCFNENLKKYAFDRGILLVKGIEAQINKKHILIYNADKNAENIKSFDDLKKYKEENNVFVVAPHPFYRTHFCLGKKLAEHIELFDAIEYSSFNTKRFFWKPNQKAEIFAQNHNLPLIGTSDVHNLYFFDQTYSVVEMDFSDWNISKYDFYVQEFFSSLRKNNLKIVSNPLSFYRFWKLNIFLMNGNIKKYFKKLTISKKGITSIHG